MMSFFAPSFCAPAPAPAPELSFTPLFRLLEDFDNYSRQAAPASPRQRRQPRSPTFKPRFDVRETEKTYELHGELPGLERENLTIEFPEPQTMVIRGRVERSYHSENTSENTTSASIETTETTPESKPEKPRRNSYQATVEDDPEDENTPATTPSSTPKLDVAAPAPKSQTQQVAQPAQPAPQYRLFERSVGEFSRVFSFPTHVDLDGVTASLSNGILSVTVPKAAKPAARRIEISA